MIVPVLDEAPTLNVPSQDIVPSRSTSVPLHVMADLAKSRAPTVVAHAAWFLPMTWPDESTTRFVKTMVSPSRLAWGDFVFVLRMCLTSRPSRAP